MWIVCRASSLVGAYRWVAEEDNLKQDGEDRCADILGGSHRVMRS
jgi:hypothetical protein